MNALTTAVNALAAYRLTRLVQEDSLPPMPAIQDEMDARLRENPDDLLATLVTCPWCLGFWMSVGVLVLDALAPRFWRPVATALAMSAAVGKLRQLD